MGAGAGARSVLGFAPLYPTYGIAHIKRENAPSCGRGDLLNVIDPMALLRYKSLIRSVGVIARVLAVIVPGLPGQDLSILAPVDWRTAAVGPRAATR